ncbi:MarR family transcriptional regulator [Prosthecochloris sp. GSB1]|uniref:MarR family winged helix-turn-helix transcriptional regulator n=1 Tax=Prosthecochloris sp. GSB1 TaxID=281093 RepID=UPI000B8CCC53|nr:MarR family winged helix-turn-helix transcriptional regulator [Prosthecochloris sp. GSB1]ASQ90760.1 MarR family transcriptional regulator [Prosthecochloris sp. GSB1]
MQQPQTKQDDQSARSLHALRRITRALDVHSRRLYREWHITSPQVHCLQVLAKKGKLSLSALAGEINLSLSTVNGIIDRLVARNFVNRTRSVQDQRKVTLEVTDAGLDLLATVPELMRDIFARAFVSLSSDDRSSMTELLEKLANHIDPFARNTAENRKIIETNHDFISGPGTDYQLH